MGQTYYNAMEVISCSDTCMCFRQVAGETADVNCDWDRRVGGGVKMICFDRCLVDCNGGDCGLTETNSQTRLMLTGSGPICASPVSEEEFVCEHTNMVTDDNGDIIDTFITPLAALAVDMPTGGTAPPMGGDDEEADPAESPASSMDCVTLPAVALMAIVAMML